MSTCSATHDPQIGAATTQARGMPPVHAGSPMSCDAAVAPPTPGAFAGSAAAAAAAAAGDAVNGQHHLLRHVLSAEQCSDALKHFGTADSKAAARMVNRMSQRELRDMFAKVYTVHTNSNNNTWLRRKLLEAVGASRRFYAAANRTGRAKPRRTAAAGAGGDAHPGAAAKPRAPKAPASAAAAHAPAGEPLQLASVATLPSSSRAHGHQQPAAYQPAHSTHHMPPPGPALPAGSPRALTQRLRRGAATGGSATSLDSHAPYHHRYLHHTGSFGASAQGHSSEGGATSSEGSDGHPCALAPHPSFDCASPTSAFAAAAAQHQQLQQQQFQHQQYQQQQYQSFQQQQYQQQLYQQQLYRQAPAISNGSNSSLQSTQFGGARAPLPQPGLGVVLPGVPVGAASCDAKPPRVSSFSTLAALLGSPAAPAVPAGDPASQLATLQPGPSADLGSLWGPTPDPALLPAKLPAEDFLAWADWELPALF